MEPLDQKDPTQTLVYALENHPGSVEAIEVRRLVMDSARKNDKRPAWVQVAVPDEIVKSVRGPREKGDLVFLVRVPRDVTERQESRIVLPGEL